VPVGDLIAIAPGLGLRVVRLHQVLDVLEAVVAAGRGHGRTKTKNKAQAPKVERKQKSHVATGGQLGDAAADGSTASPLLIGRRCPRDVTSDIVSSEEQQKYPCHINVLIEINWIKRADQVVGLSAATPRLRLTPCLSPFQFELSQKRLVGDLNGM
jgi:hypothetical protein